MDGTVTTTEDPYALFQDWMADATKGEINDPNAVCLATAERVIRERGAITFSVYSTNPVVLQMAEDASLRAGVALSINLTGGVFVNQSSGFSDFHATGANPAANACLTDSAFVANRFFVVQSRRHI